MEIKAPRLPTGAQGLACEAPFAASFIAAWLLSVISFLFTAQRET